MSQRKIKRREKFTPEECEALTRLREIALGITKHPSKLNARDTAIVNAALPGINTLLTKIEDATV